MSIPISAPDITDAEIDAVNRVLRTPYLSLGPNIIAFEDAFAGYIGVRYGIGVSSGTCGLHLCVIAAGVREGDLVVTTPFSFVASSNCVLYERGVPVFVDVDHRTGNIDPALVQETVEEIVRGRRSWLRRLRNTNGSNPGRLRALLPVHAFGQPADMDPLMEVARSHGLTVIEDSCEAVGSEYKNKKVGSLGDSAVFAFYPNKQMTTGEGGLILTEDERAAQLFRSMRNQGRDVFNGWLNHNRLGYNYRMDELSAALGLAQLRRIDELISKRGRVAGWYNERLRQVEHIEIPYLAPSTTRMSWFVYVVRIQPPADRNKVMRMLGERGIISRPYFSPIHLQSFYMKSFGYQRGDFPVTEKLGALSLALPFSSVVTQDQVDRVCENLREVLGSSEAMEQAACRVRGLEVEPQTEDLPASSLAVSVQGSKKKVKFVPESIRIAFVDGGKRFAAFHAALLSSLIGALTIRFLLLYDWGLLGDPEQYRHFVDYSIRSFLSSILPMILLSALVWYADQRWLEHYSGFSLFFRRFLRYTAFFAGMACVAALLPASASFPHQTWILAWLLSLSLAVTLYYSQAEERPQSGRFSGKQALQFAIDGAVVALGLLLAYLFRFEGNIPQSYRTQFLLLLPYVIGLYLAGNWASRVYAAIWRFTGLRDAARLALSVGSLTLLGIVGRILMQASPGVAIPFSVLFAQAIFIYVGFVSVRGLRRLQNDFFTSEKQAQRTDPLLVRRVLLVGAGNTGVMVMGQLKKRLDFEIVGFLDDDPDKIGRTIEGARVLGKTNEVDYVVKAHKIDEVILAMPTAPVQVIRQILTECESIPVKTSSIPSLTEIVLGKIKVGQIQPIRVETLLSRAQVHFNGDDKELMSTYARKRILVTGAGGSIGSELARQLIKLNPSVVLLLDKDENGLYEVTLQIQEEHKGEIVPLVADVRDRDRMRQVFTRYRPDVIFQAAAYKHVPMMERDPSEAVVNNVVGSKNVIELASEHEAERFIFISTDKAVHPTSVMGATKRVVEMLVRHQALTNGVTQFCCVRFGNVLGSRASVVPLFERWIGQRKNIKVTHPEIERYFMTIPEAVQMVIQAGTMAGRGETFTLDMGDPVKIVDLAKDLIKRSGLVLGQDIDIEFTGLRPGEKLFEELLYEEENGRRSPKYPKIFVGQPPELDGEELSGAVHDLEQAARAGDSATIYKTFSSLHMGYSRPEEVPSITGFSTVSARHHAPDH